MEARPKQFRYDLGLGTLPLKQLHELRKCEAQLRWRGRLVEWHGQAERKHHFVQVLETTRRIPNTLSTASWSWALSAVAAQVLWIVVYRKVAAPVNAELTRLARAGSVSTDARALQARWDSVIVARVLLMGFAVIALAAALVRSAQLRAAPLRRGKHLRRIRAERVER